MDGMLSAGGQTAAPPRCELDLDGACVRADQQSRPVDLEGLLSHAVLLDDLGSEDHQGSTGRGLEHLGSSTLGELACHPLFSCTAPSPRDCAQEEVPVCTRSLPCHTPLLALDGEQRDATDPNPSLMTCHGGHECPAVHLWVIHLHRAEVGLSIVTSHSIEAPAAGHQGDPTATRVHGHNQAPLVSHGAVHLGDTEEAGAVVAPTHEHPASQGGGSVPTALVEHGRRGVPAGRVVVVVLHL